MKSPRNKAQIRLDTLESGIDVPLAIKFSKIFHPGHSYTITPAIRF